MSVEQYWIRFLYDYEYVFQAALRNSAISLFIDLFLLQFLFISNMASLLYS